MAPSALMEAAETCVGAIVAGGRAMSEAGEEDAVLAYRSRALGHAAWAAVTATTIPGFCVSETAKSARGNPDYSPWHPSPLGRRGRCAAAGVVSGARAGRSETPVAFVAVNPLRASSRHAGPCDFGCGESWQIWTTIVIKVRRQPPLPPLTRGPPVAGAGTSQMRRPLDDVSVYTASDDMAMRRWNSMGSRDCCVLHCGTACMQDAGL